jgi:hypothetical protein
MRRCGFPVLVVLAAGTLSLPARPGAQQAPGQSGGRPPGAKAPAAKGPSPDPAAAPAGEAWKKELDDLCARTQDAMALTTAELRSLVERCDKLKPAVEALGESERKVYARRLAGCRNLYAYVLDARPPP